MSGELGPAIDHVLALADDEQLMGHGHSQWIAVAPFLEEDLAFASIGQDELGHAAALYELCASEAGPQLDHREPSAWRSAWLVERHCALWEHALVRHWLYDSAEVHRWESFATGTHEPLQMLAQRALREETYHRRHAQSTLDRLLSATPQATERLAGAIELLLPEAVLLFEPTAAGEHALNAGVIGIAVQEQAARWRRDIDATLAGHGLEIPWPDIDTTRQRERTVRSVDFGAVHDALTEVINLDRSATW